MSLSDSTIKKAEKLVNEDKIQQLDQHTFLIEGSKGDVYEVITNDPNHGFYCKNTNQKEPCKGWQFKRECKHIEGVKIYIKKQSG